MAPVPVQIVSSEIDWPAWAQAVLSAIAIPLSVWVGILLQDRERSRKAADERVNQLVAFTAIAERCTNSIQRLKSRTADGTLTHDKLGWLKDEAAAVEATVGAIDLTQIRSAELIGLISELQEAARTGRRRLTYAANTIKEGNKVKLDQFDDPYNRSLKVFNRLKKLGELHHG